jgi:hypothetical protein
MFFCQLAWWRKEWMFPFVQLPHKTPILRQVEGKVKDSKEWAKRSSALVVIRLLYEKGELDDSLKV